MMKVARKIEQKDWMQAPETRAVMEALNEGTTNGPKALFVGGCVRNALLGTAVSDIDIATQRVPENSVERLESAGIKVVPTGIAHGTVTAVVNGKGFEITSLRRDVETDGRRAVVAFTQNWEEDAQRRDFTMNTLLADAEGHIYDPTGRGLTDLAARRVVFVGDPATRIAEDYLRILRFFRFHVYYGAEAPDAAALAACAAASGKIGDLSRERITQEFLKILSVDNPVDILSLMFENKILTEIIHEKYEKEILSRVSGVVSRLIVLAGFDDAHLSVFETRLLFSHQQKKAFSKILQALMGMDSVAEKPVKVLVYRYGSDIAGDAVRLFLARKEARKDESETNDTALEIIQNWQAPAFPLTGEDVKNAGVAEGPEIGRILSAVEEWWIAQDFEPSHEDCLDILKTRMES